MPASPHFNRFLAHYVARIIAVTAIIDYILGTCFGRPHYFKPPCPDKELHMQKDSREAANKKDTELYSFFRQLCAHSSY